MKKQFLPFLGALILSIGCKKSSSGGDAPPAAPSPYMSKTANSTWQYEQVNNATSITTNYTLTSTTRDSTINGKPYHVYTNSSTGGSEYYNITGSDYFQYRDLPAALGSAKVDALYLKDNLAVGGSWSQPVNVTVSGVTIALTLTYTILEKGVAKTVSGINYTDVITVKTDITPNTPGIPASALTTDIKSYFARKVGLIQNDTKVVVNFMGFNQTTDTQLKLKSSDIK
jgi:hypothetical protein